jgi:capsular exopolysaccharide synthesis family protein
MGRISDALKRAEQERRAAMAAPETEDDRTGSHVEEPFSPVDIPVPIISEEADEEPLSLVQGLSEALVPYYDSSSLITEQYRSLRTRLLSSNPQYEHRVIAVTSGAPREGKSVTTLNLGCILAEIRHLKVLVVDGDFRRGSLAGMLNQPGEPGLAEVLSGETPYEEVIRKTPMPNLYFIPPGDTKNRSAAELLTAANARHVFKRMHDDFHYAVVDTPPATTVTDVGIIGQMCSGVIVIVRMNQSHEAIAKRAVRLLQVNNIPIIGCLVIGRESPMGRYGYSYDYGYYYNRYYDYYRKKETSEKS